MAIRIRQTQMQPQKWACGKVSQKAEGSSGGIRRPNVNSVALLGGAFPLRSA